MTMRCAHWVMTGLLASAITAPAMAATHHHHGHATAHHAKKSGKPSHKALRKTAKQAPVRHEPGRPAGVVPVPAGGLKVYCAARSPLLIRKSTQGNGTTVTVICR